MTTVAIAVAVGTGVFVAIALVCGAFRQDAANEAARRKISSEQPLPRPLGL